MTDDAPKRRHVTQSEAARIHAIAGDSLDDGRKLVQDAASLRGLDLASVDWEYADGAYRWAMALKEELAPGPGEREVEDDDDHGGANGTGVGG